ncbi:hypothetical protein ACFVTM_18245 [Arthrobacter sp. NPDC058130]|uniref:hypothetical protein n=1 Tax=Arthrobacter sp. NPDC058130 TaxID=3346353 RepID=UPI0036EE2DF1
MAASTFRALLQKALDLSGGPANGAASNVQVWFDGKLLYSSHRVGTGFTTLTCLHLGAEHPRQVGDSDNDDVVINAT